MEELRKVWQALLSPPILISAVGMGCLILAVVILGTGLLSGGADAQENAALTVIAGQTSTPYVPTPTATRFPTPTSNVHPTPLPGMIGVGSTVQITGTEGSGLNIRSGAGLTSSVNFVALDSEIFEVRDGPQIVNDITWWYLVTPLDESRNGWAAADYLSLVSVEEN